MAEGELTPKQQRFVEEYLLDHNGTKAAIRAGYSKHTANEQAAGLLAKPSIRIEVDARIEERKKRSILTLDRLDLELARLGFSDSRKLLDADGNILPVNQWSDDAAASVASIESIEVRSGSGEEQKVTGTLKKLKVWDKVSALTLIAKRLGAINESKNVNVNLSLEVLVAASMKADPTDEAKTIEHEEKK